MIKNLPFILALFLLGLSLRTIVTTASLSPFIHWTILIISTMLLIWSMIAMILNIGVQRIEKIRSEMDL
ncbi:putative membrane protein YadS [Metabacillus crassostreae]|uniref:hypothetical protein n=1 Tax=Metabacillus crassostreae TaxID=929098 RepID=UPI00195A3477|nr:hypothetical protein [Metabacillus crassostreae]MBM7602762.1 putative membrane protein YadS [Metabacillus crassostreae]